MSVFTTRNSLKWIALGLIALLTLALYVPSMTLPLSFDDAWSVRLVGDYTFVDLFTRTYNFGYYRPLYLAYYRLASLMGAKGPTVLHGLCIIAHVINALLSYRVGRAVLGDSAHARSTALVTALLFACNPLSVQAVALPAGLNHLIALIFLQLAILSYTTPLLTQRPRRGNRLIGAALFSIVAFLANEIALCVPGLLMAYEVARLARGEKITPASFAFLWIGGLAAIYAVMYTLIPKGESPAFVLTLDGIVQRMLIAAQALAYPLVWLLSPIDVSGAASAVVASALAGLAMAYAWRTSRVALVAGLVMFLVAVALPILRLPTGYVENAQRVFYVASLGSSLVWAALVIALGTALAARFPMLPRIFLHTAGAILVALPGVVYAQDTQRFYAQASEPVRAIVNSGAQLQQNETLLALNVPEWISVPQRRFPLFIEGAILMAPYVDGRDLVLSNTAIDRRVALQRFQLPYQPELRYAFQAFGEDVSPAPSKEAITNATRVLNVTYTPGGPRTAWLGGATMVHPASVEAIFRGQIAIAQHHILPCKDGWVVALQWRKLPPASEGALTSVTLSAFAQAFETGGAPIAQKDGAPVGGLLQFVDLPEDRDILDRRVLTTTNDVPPGALYVGIYDYTSGARLPARNASGQPLEGNAFTLPLPPRDPNTPCQ
jgi:hypothetical protein